jgi:hypothetical protein
MKQLQQFLVMAACTILFAGLAGCQNVEHFPEVMTGLWEGGTAKSKWAFEFQTDGTIFRMNHAMAGEVDLSEGGAHIEGGAGPVSTEFLLGPCQAEYDPDTREVTIEVIVDYYKIQSLGTALEGSQSDLFKGPVSEDGKTWNAEWLSYLEIKDKELRRDMIKPKHIIFTKVAGRSP